MREVSLVLYFKVNARRYVLGVDPLLRTAGKLHAINKRQPKDAVRRLRVSNKPLLVVPRHSADPAYAFYVFLWHPVNCHRCSGHSLF